MAFAPLLAHAGSGAYLVDDSSITPAGQCQWQNWLQALSAGQQVLNALPACSTGPVEWSATFSAQNGPGEHQESPAVKWMILDADKRGLGLAINVGATWPNGHVTSRNTYAAMTWMPDDAHRWSTNIDVGEIYDRSRGYRPLVGVGLKYRMTSQLAWVVEHIRPWNGLSMTQAGLRWSFKKASSVDLIVGRSDATAHRDWFTVGLNFPL